MFWRIIKRNETGLLEKIFPAKVSGSVVLHYSLKFKGFHEELLEKNKRSWKEIEEELPENILHPSFVFLPQKRFSCC